ncbi:MAG: AmmeMemoRadiSam system protein B [bacterium]|nr:AmmeMemoRadiSam system protein B [bacterium]
MRKAWRLSKYSLVSIGAAALALAIVGNFAAPRQAPALHAAPLEIITPTVVKGAFLRGQAVVPVPKVASFVISHHLVAANLMGRVIGAARDARPQTIVIVGPDHPNRGVTRFTTSRTTWMWQGQRYAPPHSIVDALVAEPDVRADELLIAEEHSVLTPLPFLQRQFPHVQFVLLTVQSNFDTAAALRMAEFLNRTLGQHDLVVASVDFSHYKNLEATKADDAISLAALAQASPNALRGIPADSPMSLAIAMAFAQLRGANAQTLVDHTNGAELTGNLAETSTTSYIDVVFHGK